MKINRTLSIAPMMDCTDRYFRYFMRLLDPSALLYTEMLTTGAVIHGDRARYLDYDQQEHPLALQLGGNDPAELSQCADIAQTWGYDEVNLNVGCPSNRVQAGGIGACLFKSPALVASACRAMRAACDLPITVKTRLGVDDQDSYEHLTQFVSEVADAGVEVFIIHARKAWLKGLNPKQNRSVPPLQYERVYQLKQDFPHLTIIINGGIQTHKAIDDHLQRVDGVMLGRAAYDNPYLIATWQNKLPPGRMEVLQMLLPYIQQHHQSGIPLNRMLRHYIGLFHATPGAKNWRRAFTNPKITYQDLLAMLPG